ncbi:hypothetical protein [Gramella sp. MAR_2010_147]|uniref:hypothetical protein n=1 Tax=Gramella sp. MAR_2010_147 TaxID=1250205 RepID=UPI0008792F97|nr:hypothetical protein [Gramella sp. MAR_2010_147]SDS28691.1 hypothetical protein SAMN04488553_1908 [Gramella sp. MAR_2010_147]
MNFNLKSRDLKFFILGVLAAFIFVIVYDWDDFERGLTGEPGNISSQTEMVK